MQNLWNYRRQINIQILQSLIIYLLIEPMKKIIVTISLMFVHILCEKFLSRIQNSFEQAFTMIIKPKDEFLEKWNKTVFFSSIDQTISAHHYLKKNMKATKMAQLFEQGACGNYSQFAQLLVLNNRIYSYGKSKQDKRAIVYENYLRNIVAKHKIPDLYMIIHLNSLPSEENIDGQRYFRCRSLPFFVTSKNASSDLERNKFLLPHLSDHNQWEKQVQQVKKISRQFRWEDKIAKVFIDQPSSLHFDLQFMPSTSYSHKEIQMPKSPQSPGLIDAKLTQYYRFLVRQIEKQFSYGNNQNQIKQINIAQYIQYKYVLTTDSTQTQSRKISQILFSNSILFKTQSERIQWFYDKLIPDQHFILIQSNLSNMFSQMQKMNRNVNTKKIHQQANAFAQEYLTLEGIKKYTVETLKKYASLQNLTLNQQQKQKIKQKIDINIILNQKRKRQQAQHEAILQKQWRENIRYATFDQTIQAFPFIKQNINLTKIIQLFQSGGCGGRSFPLLIIDNQIYWGGPFKKNPDLVDWTSLIERILKKVKLPDMFFVLHHQDYLHGIYLPKELHQSCRELPAFTYSKNCSSYLQQTKFLLPDYYVVKNWGQEIHKVKKEAKKNKWESKVSKAFFLGIGSSPYTAHVQMNSNTDIGRYYHRGEFVLLSNERPDLINARLTPWGGCPLYDELKKRIGNNKFVVGSQPFQTHLKYKYLLTADGYGAPWKRTPSILFSNSLLLRPYSQIIQWFSHKMEPGVNFVQINQDLSDLTTKIQEMNMDDTKTLQIIQSANIMAEKYLTPEALDEYTIEILKKYAAIQNLKISDKAKQMIRGGHQILTVLKLTDKEIQQIIILQSKFDIATNVCLILIVLAVIFLAKQNLKIRMQIIPKTITNQLIQIHKKKCIKMLRQNSAQAYIERN